jgi:stage II sporulation protein D
LEQKLNQAGYLTGTIQSVKIGGRNNAGAVSKLIIEGNKDTVSLEKENIRSVLGTSLVRSRHFSIGTEYLGGDGMSSIIADFQLNNGHIKKDVGEKVYLLSAGDKLKEVNSAELHITNGNKTIKTKTTETPSDTPDSVVATGDKVIFTGAGSGHGVGMSQDGAIEMARQGFTFDQILRFYYTDIEVR